MRWPRAQATLEFEDFCWLHVLAHPMNCNRGTFGGISRPADWVSGFHTPLTTGTTKHNQARLTNTRTWRPLTTCSAQVPSAIPSNHPVSAFSSGTLDDSLLASTSSSSFGLICFEILLSLSDCKNLPCWHPCFVFVALFLCFLQLIS